MNTETFISHLTYTALDVCHYGTNRKLAGLGHEHHGM